MCGSVRKTSGIKEITRMGLRIFGNDTVCPQDARFFYEIAILSDKAPDVIDLCLRTLIDETSSSSGSQLIGAFIFQMILIQWYN